MKIHFNDLTIYSLMTYLSDIAKDTKTRDRMLSINSRDYLCEISKRDYAGLFLYDKELMIKDIKTFMDIKDIKYNRQFVLNNVFITYPKNGDTYPVINRYGNILIYQLNIRDIVKQSNYDKFRLLLMVSEHEISQIIKNVQE
jgi:hypothetical protein